MPVSGSSYHMSTEIKRKNQHSGKSQLYVFTGIEAGMVRVLKTALHLSSSLYLLDFCLFVELFFNG